MRRTSTIASTLLGLFLAGCFAGPVGNANVPQPIKEVDIMRYAGRWYEIGRYENSFEKGCEAVTADYSLKADGEVRILNSCRQGSPTGPLRSSEGSARVVPGSRNTKLKVSFFGPFYVGNYWILDYAADYSWSIVGEPSGRYLWLLARGKSPAVRSRLIRRAEQLGYDISRVHFTKH
jgi:apolipoprotein D and lipocalin family protein